MKSEEQILKARERQRRYVSKNREKTIAASLKWNQANKEKMNDAAKRHYEKTKNDLDFKVKNAQKTREWARKNPDKVLEQSARKRATKLKRIPKWLTKENFEKIKEFYRLAKDKTAETGAKHHVDHIIPLRGFLVSGFHIPENLQVIPAYENMSKSNKFNELLSR
jgi:hypothetical protein